MRRLTFLAAALLGASAVRAQDHPGQLRVEIVPSTPGISRVAARGDSVYFWMEYAPDSSAYAFDRRNRRFARVRFAAAIQEPLRANNARSPVGQRLTDSLSLDEVRLEDGTPTTVVRTAGGRAIGLRSVRVAAERRWRARNRLPAWPRREGEEDYYPHAPNPTDWAPVDPLAVAVDSQAVWIGLQHMSSIYLDFALGGLLRVDRRTHRVTVVEDPALLHASVTQIEPVPGGYLVVADGVVLRFDPARLRTSPLPGAPSAQELLFANDTLFIADGPRITVVDQRSGRALRKGFRLTLAGDSLVYALADSTVEPGWDFLAAAGTAYELGIRRMGDWMRAAVGVVRPAALEYYFPGDRVNYVVGIDSVRSDGGVPEEELEGPNGLFVEGLTQPALRPFLREALLSAQWYTRLTVAKLLLDAADTAATPFLRVALDSTPYPHNAELAVALALLGDSAGHRWVRTALADTLRPSASGDSAQRVHHFVFDAAARVRDPANVPRLLALARDDRYTQGATGALLAYPSADVWRRLLAALTTSDSTQALSAFFGAVASDSAGITFDAALRDSARAAARRAMRWPPNHYRENAVRVLVRFGDGADLPHLIAALTVDEYAYNSAVRGLVELTGEGVDAMPTGNGTPVTRLAAQRWWMEWHERHRAGFRRASPQAAQAALAAMHTKLYR